MTRNIGWHIIFRLIDDRVIAPSVEARRTCARVIAGIGREADLLLFSVPDNHGHSVVGCSRAMAGQFARRVELALHRHLGLSVPFESARVRPVNGQGHLDSLVDYVLGNSARHGARVDPLLEASNLPDLLGLRLVARDTAARLREALPRLRRQRLLAHYEVDDLVAGTHPGHLADAAAATVGRTRLRGQLPDVFSAKVAAVRVGTDLELGTAQIAARLDLSARSVRRIAGQQPEPTLVRSIRLQIGLREVLGIPPRTGISGSIPSSPSLARSP